MIKLVAKIFPLFLLPRLESEKSVLYLGDISGIEKLLVCSNFEGRFQVDIGSRGFVRGIVGGWNER